MGPMIRDLSLGPTIVAALVFLAIGLLGLVKPYAVQSFALRVYRDPQGRRDRRIDYLESHSYIVALRVIGFLCTTAGLALAATVVGALIVPGLAEFR